jgi:Fe(3+) dicitrate transport protein
LNYFFTFFLLLIYPILSQDKTSNDPQLKSVSEESKQTKKNSDEQNNKGQINIIGDGKDSLKKIPGSATIIGKKYLDETTPVDAMEVLRRVPGASVRSQDAAGLTPNIGFRGVSNEESRKTLILEDGILTSLSPYGQPESYYIPQIDRMQRVEIIKGSGSILFGPSTIGGIVNFVTRKAPYKPTFYSKSQGGENGYISNFSQYGGTFGKTSIDVSYNYKQGDGFRDFQKFNVKDIYFKIGHDLNEKHSISLKLGHNAQDAQSTYLGLTQGLFWKNPRINPAEYDRKYLNRNSVVIGHVYTYNDSIKIITRLYSNQAIRNWQRQDFTYNNLNSNGVESPPPSDLFLPYSPGFVGVRSGDILYMRNGSPIRNQSFSTGGLDVKLEATINLLGLKHELDIGGRVHGEQNKVNTKNSPYPFIRDGFPVNQQDRKATAYSIYIQDRISLSDKFKIMPGIRYEWIRQGVYTKRRQASAQDVRDRRASKEGDTLFVDQGNESYTKVLLPGFGITYDLTNSFTWFAGMHKGFSPPTYGTAVSPTGTDYRLKGESSTNYETGLRGEITNYLFTEVAGYILYFKDQIINTNEIGGEVGTRPVNSGKSIHRGSENTVTFDFGKFFKTTWLIPLDLIYTYTNAKSISYTPYPYSTNADGTIKLLTDRPNYFFDQKFHLINNDTNRNYLPYVPMNTYTIALGVSKSGYYLRTEYQYMSKQYSDLINSPNESTDGNRGVIPEVGLVNASFGFKHPEKKWSVFITGKNLADREYVSGRLPAGIQPGAFRQVNFGFSFEL